MPLIVRTCENGCTLRVLFLDDFAPIVSIGNALTAATAVTHARHHDTVLRLFRCPRMSDGWIGYHHARSMGGVTASPVTHTTV